MWYAIGDNQKDAKNVVGNKKTRPRFLTTYTEFLATDNKPPMDVLDKYIEEFLTSKARWSLRYQLNKIRKQFPTNDDAYKDLCKLLVQYVSTDGLIVEPSKEKVDWMAGGICLVEGSGDNLHYRIAEVSF